LSRDRSDARKYPAIHPLESWSKYPGAVDKNKVEYGHHILYRGNEIDQMMKVVGEEGTSLDDYVVYLKGDFLDAVYLQQNAFDPVDSAVNTERQRYMFDLLLQILSAKLDLADKAQARTYFYQLRQKFLDLNSTPWNTDSMKSTEKEIRKMLEDRKIGIVDTTRDLTAGSNDEEE
jgi:V/A-type H+-transporting ATPase subunit A